MDSLSGLLPIALVLLICPLLMLVFMRGMHGGHDAHDAPQQRRNGHGRSASDAMPAQKLQAIEEELAALRLELDATERARDPERQPSEANPEKPPAECV